MGVGPASDFLVGRERELGEVRSWLTDAGGPRLVLVRGELGVGRTVFVHEVAERLRTEGAFVRVVGCVPGDGARPFLLALRLVMALEERRSAEAVRAAGQRDEAVMRRLLGVALARSAVVVVDDAQHADADSLALLAGTDFAGVSSGVRLLASAAGRGERDGAGTGRSTSSSRKGAEAAGTVGQLAGVQGARTIVLSRLAPDETTAVLARRLGAIPDTGLARRVRDLTCGLPGAVDALLTEWVRQGVIRVADGHAFVGVRTPTPVLRDDDRFMRALDALGEPCRTVAGALSILWPLGVRAVELIAESAGLSTDAVRDALRDLNDAEIVEDLPSVEGTPAQGCAFGVPLVAHALRERLGPLDRSRLSAIAVETLWADADGVDAASGVQPPTTVGLDEVDAVAYLADRIAEAGSLVDRDRAVTELTAAAERLHPDSEGRGMLRWCQAAGHLVERPADRVPALHRYAVAAYFAGDFRTARTIAESILRNRPDILGRLELQETATLFTVATADDLDWQALSRLATEAWWDELSLPVLATTTGRALALCLLARWREALDLLARTEPVWTTDVRARANPACFRDAAELALGRPERFRRSLAIPEAPHIGPDHAYALTVAKFDELLNGGDLHAAEALLAAQGLTLDLLPRPSLFLLRHLRGEWDQALEPTRWMLANNQFHTPALDKYVIPARTAAILLARGRVTSARRVLDGVRVVGEGPPETSLDAAEAALLLTLGDPTGAEKSLRRGLDAADAHGQIAGTDQLWFSLTELLAEAGRTTEAVTCLEHLERVSDRTGSGRARLSYLLASARVLRQDSPATAEGQLREAVELARSRSQPYETAVTLVAAAEAGAAPPALLREAYDLFGQSGAALDRFHTRTAMRTAGITVPGRKQATVESEQLLATLIAEGLTNRQIATVLRLTEDAVANRLSRLFARTGLRSRTEVVTAVLTGHRTRGLAPDA
ncbi:AAA family ATPase [Streptomyces xylophagus]|uniref:AAA family ATPase n=1 Tax=Streptomyces xylophagus TaxID=285514 RepID=UPI001F2D81F3|nr:LuxR family transcriptional regulator [Streptomyces xylophagus]